MSEAADPDDPTDDLPEQVRVRREKYDRLVDSGEHAPYPAAVARTDSLTQVRARFPDLAADVATDHRVGVTGRVIFVRNTGKLCFAMLREGDAELQVMLSRDQVGAESLAAWKGDVDLGDLVFVHGEVISSRRGELSVLADDWQITAKALQPLPVAHKPLSDETRVRQRYVDLIVRPDARRTLHLRAEVLHSLRSTLRAGGYVEVETPVLQSMHGGAAARPFRTHLNAFDQQMSLRIATELYLKRVLVGGIERVYEIGPVFRNEGIDSTHSPEYTLLEAYESYGDVHSMARLTQSLIVEAAAAVGAEGGLTSAGEHIDLGGQWRVASIYDLVSAAVDEHVTPDTEAGQLRRLAAARDVALPEDTDAPHIVLELFDELAEHLLIAPTFVSDYPAAVRPLARPHRDDPRLSEAWDLIIGGTEVGHPVTELVDPVEQRRRLVAQSVAAAHGDPEAMALDEEFLRAMEYGLPPSGGTGLGVDRLLMLLTGKGIRETILFPFMKPL